MRNGFYNFLQMIRYGEGILYLVGKGGKGGAYILKTKRSCRNPEENGGEEGETGNFSCDFWTENERLERGGPSGKEIVVNL